MISPDDIWEGMARLADAVAVGIAARYAATKCREAGNRRDYAADKLAGLALSKVHHAEGSITLSLGIKAGSLVYTGHPPGIHIGPVAEIRID